MNSNYPFRSLIALILVCSTFGGAAAVSCAAVAGAGGGALLDGGFEDGVLTAWEPFGGAPRLSHRPDARSGQYGLVFDLLPENRPAWQGVVQAFPAREGDEFTVSAWGLAVNPGANFSYLEVEFLDSERRPFGLDMKARSENVSAESGWTLREVFSGTAPEGTRFAEVRLVVFGQNHDPAQNSHFAFDDVVVRPGRNVSQAAAAPITAVVSARATATSGRPAGASRLIDDLTGWTLFAPEFYGPELQPRLVPAAARSGEFGILLQVGGVTPGYGGAYHEMPVSPGATYTVRYHVKAPGGVFGSVAGTVAMEWLDALGQKLFEPLPSVWSSQISGNGWEEFLTTDTAPARATGMRLVFALNAHEPDARARYYLDDVSITR